LVVHTEDLVNPRTKFALVHQIAKFVGSNFTEDQLCCIVNESPKFMGTHEKQKKISPHQTVKTVKTVKNGRFPPPISKIHRMLAQDQQEILASRFGHWHSKVLREPELNKTLHTIGKVGLNVFGYYPLRPPLEFPDYKCVLTHEQCQNIKKGFPVDSAPNPQISSPQAATCHFEQNIKYSGGFLYSILTDTYQACCDECYIAEQCIFFTFDKSKRLCNLSSGKKKKQRTPKFMFRVQLSKDNFHQTANNME